MHQTPNLQHNQLFYWFLFSINILTLLKIYLSEELDFQSCEKFKQLMKHMKLKKEQILQEMLQFAKQSRTTRTPAFWGYPLSHDYPYYWVILDPKSEEDKVKVTNLKNLPKFQIFWFWNKHYTRHTFWSCLIRYANMRWIRWILLRYRADTILSTNRQTDRRTDGRTDGWTDGQGETSIPPFQLCWRREYNYYRGPSQY